MQMIPLSLWKMVLSAYEKLSGLKINFHKSEMFCFGKAKERENVFSLQIPRASNWKELEERF